MRGEQGYSNEHTKVFLSCEGACDPLLVFRVEPQNLKVRDKKKAEESIIHIKKRFISKPSTNN